MGWGLCLATSVLLWLSFSSLLRAEDGFLSFYGPVFSPDDGACGFGRLDLAAWPFGRFVSLGANNSLTQQIGSNDRACGQCIQARCVGQGCRANATTTVLYVTDECDCADSQLTVPQDVFLQYFGSSLALGQVNITYRQVDCQPPGNITVKVLNSRTVGGSYVAFVLLNLVGDGGLLGVDLRSAGNSSYRPVVNTYGNVWEASNIGDPPYALRIQSYNKPPLVIENAIPTLATGQFESNRQFPNSTLGGISTPPVVAARPPSQSAFVIAPSRAPSPSESSIVYTARDLPTIQLTGVRIDVPLYYAPLDASVLGAYPGIKFSFTDCRPQAPSVNLTIERIQALDAPAGALRAWSLHATEFRPVTQVGSTSIFRLVQSTFFNLETGSLAQLYQPAYVTFTNTSYDGVTIPVQDPATNQTIFPIYLNASAVSSPGGLSYTLLLPPGPNEDPTPAYLVALKTMFYYLTTLTLGNNGDINTNPTCASGFPATGPWADYVRTVLSQLAPPTEVIGDLYDGVPLGLSYSFQGRSFVINNALIAGEVVNTTTQLSAQDCGAQCRSFAGRSNTTNFSTWSWCGSISGCGSTAYQACDVKISTAAENSTNARGTLNYNHSSSYRLTSGSLILPPPTGISTLFLNLPNSTVQTSSGPPTSG